MGMKGGLFQPPPLFFLNAEFLDERHGNGETFWEASF
jgi:hypothetical protein